MLSISALNKDQWDPEFLKAIPIMKTRSGMQVRNNIRGSVCNKSVAMIISVHTMKETLWSFIVRNQTWVPNSILFAIFRA